MLRIFIFLLTGYWHKCRHKWETIRPVDVFHENLLGLQIPVPHHRDYECRCKVCGEIKTFSGARP